MPNLRSKVSDFRAELDKVIAGHDEVKNQAVLALLADGHLLLEAMPGMGKTMLCYTIAHAIENCVADNMSLTPETKPSDILGTRVWDREKSCFQILPGPIIGKNIFHIDEINRTTGKTLSALLETMQQRKTNLFGQIFTLPDFFLVLATMNPIETEGTYVVPEAAVDRFAVKLNMTRVSRAHSKTMLRNVAVHGRHAMDLVTPRISIDEFLIARQEVMEMAASASDQALEYITDLVRATDKNESDFQRVHGPDSDELAEQIMFTLALARAEISMLRLSAANAYRANRDHIIPDDIKAVARGVLRHRVILNPAVMGEHNVETVITRILDHVKVVGSQS